MIVVGHGGAVFAVRQLFRLHVDVVEGDLALVRNSKPDDALSLGMNRLI